MQFRDLKIQYRKLQEKIDFNIREVIESTQFISGPKVKELENALAEYTGRKHCISCANGTDAIELVLRGWGIGAGDAVFVPSFTFMSTAEVVALVGAHPVFIDIDAKTFNMDSVHLEKEIERVLKEGKYVPRVVIPVDLFGLPADFSKIIPIAQKYNLKILEDGAQGFGGSIQSQKACSFGDSSTTSFFPAKPLGCYGDGGAIFTDDDEFAILLRSLSIHGKGKEKYENIRIGRNSRLDSIQAAILLPKLEAFSEYELDDVNRVAAEYTERLTGKFRVPEIPSGFVSSWAQYTIQCDSMEHRKKIQEMLKEKGIPSMIYYPCGLHLQKAFSCCGYKEGDLPRTEEACRTVLSLPMHPYLETEEIDQICRILLSI